VTAMLVSVAAVTASVAVPFFPPNAAVTLIPVPTPVPVARPFVPAVLEIVALPVPPVAVHVAPLVRSYWVPSEKEPVAVNC
jgi:hypothetical protein